MAYSAYICSYVLMEPTEDTSLPIHIVNTTKAYTTPHSICQSKLQTSIQMDPPVRTRQTTCQH